MRWSEDVCFGQNLWPTMLPKLQEHTFSNKPVTIIFDLFLLMIGNHRESFILNFTFNLIQIKLPMSESCLKSKTKMAQNKDGSIVNNFL